MTLKISMPILVIAILACSACVVVPDGGYYGAGPGYYGYGPSYYDYGPAYYGYYGYAPLYPWATGINVDIVGGFGRDGGHRNHGGFSGHGRGGRR